MLKMKGWPIPKEFVFGTLSYLILGCSICGKVEGFPQWLLLKVGHERSTWYSTMNYETNQMHSSEFMQKKFIKFILKSLSMCIINNTEK